MVDVTVLVIENIDLVVHIVGRINFADWVNSDPSPVNETNCRSIPTQLGDGRAGRVKHIHLAVSVIRNVKVPLSIQG
jgi:hypothetical protein